ncbi:hypothetical protein QBC44DRAFT_107025 [Cladorrhinum sp. PSN332]|nr:hypothetical protein QBC44DRAFT_107025 [Cladorrhinum sp. PSN332]
MHQNDVWLLIIHKQKVMNCSESFATAQRCCVLAALTWSTSSKRQLLVPGRSRVCRIKTRGLQTKEQTRIPPTPTPSSEFAVADVVLAVLPDDEKGKKQESWAGRIEAFRKSHHGAGRSSSREAVVQAGQAPSYRFVDRSHLAFRAVVAAKMNTLQPKQAELLWASPSGMGWSGCKWFVGDFTSWPLVSRHPHPRRRRSKLPHHVPQFLHSTVYTEKPCQDDHHIRTFSVKERTTTACRPPGRNTTQTCRCTATSSEWFPCHSGSFLVFSALPAAPNFPRSICLMFSKGDRRAPFYRILPGS